MDKNIQIILTVVDDETVLGVPIPEDIITKAREHGCVGEWLWVYKDGQYGGRPPKASIACTRATQFRTGSWEKFKVELEPGWVAFRSPSGTRLPGSNPVRVAGKGECIPCLICGEDRITDEAHFPTPQRNGGTETIPLCPTHHRLLDHGRLSDWELKEIHQKRYSQLGMSYHEFLDWAYGNKYPYSFADMLSKAVRKRCKEARQITYRIENGDLGC